MVDQVKEEEAKLGLVERARKAQESLISRHKGEDGEIVQTTPYLPEQVTKAVPSSGPWYFQSNKPGFSFIYKVTRKQIRFDNFYFKTDDRKIANFIGRCYGNDVVEITKEEYEEGTTLRPGAQEPVKSSIVVTKLPG